MNQLQTTFHLPDFIITEIIRHVHQLHLTEVNQEYYQTWELALRSKCWGVDGGWVWLNARWYKGYFIRHARFRDHTIYITNVEKLPLRYWYTSGSNRPDGYR